MTPPLASSSEQAELWHGGKVDQSSERGDDERNKIFSYSTGSIYILIYVLWVKPAFIIIS
jgi:hypothetical protein